MSIPYTRIPQGAIQPEIAINDSLQMIAAVAQCSVEQTLNTPPTTTLTDVEKVWLVGPVPTGVWVGFANQLAICTAANVWRFAAPGTNSWVIWDKPGAVLKRWNGTAWVVYAEQVQRGFKNFLINGDFAINQRGFAGGALAAGVYGHDRWKAGTGGCNYTVNATTAVITHSSGPLVQVIEAPRLASTQVMVSVEDPSGTIAVNLDGQTGSITSGTGRRGVILTLTAGSTGNVTLTLTATSVTYKRVQIELGSTATPFEWRPAQIEMALCQRYYWKTFDQAIAPVQNSGSFKGGVAYIANFAGAGFVGMRVAYPVKMRTTPSVTFYNPAAANANWRNRATPADSGPASLAYSELGDSSLVIANNQVAGDLVGQTIYVHLSCDAEL